MTVSAQTPINRSTGNGVTTVFPYQFKIIAEADIEVAVDDVVKTLNVDYTLSGVGVDAGGNVTMTVAPANATTVVRRRNMALTRTTDYQDQGSLPAATLDQDIDSTVLMIQQLDDQIGRSITVPAGITGFDTELPDPVASRFLRINSAGTAIEYVSTVTPGALAVSAYIETLLDDATAAIARATLAAAGSGLATASGLTQSTARILGRITAATGAIEELTAAQVAAFTAVATTSAQGVSELATTAEVQTGTDATRTVTPAGLRGALGLSHSYTSTAQTITSAGALTLAHGMSVKPRFIAAWLVCTSAEFGYSVSDEVSTSITSESDSAADNRGMAITRDATNINIRFASGASVFVIARKDTGVGVSATNGSWTLVIEALA